MLWARADQAGETRLEVASDSGFTRVASSRSRRRRRTTSRSSGASKDFSPGTRYWYRFTRGTARSDVGTFVTAPKRNDNANIRFGWTGDYDAEHAAGQTEPFWNNFDVFERMQAERNDFNIALGDTIYSDSEVPGRLNPVALTVAQKWAKYKLNLGQEKLADLRGSAGFYSHWDDHEFINDFSRSENVFSSGTINGEELYQRGVKAFTDYAPVAYSSAGRPLPHQALGQQPGAVLPRRALVPLGEGVEGRRLRQPADRQRRPGADRPAERSATCSRPSMPSLSQPVPRPASTRSTIPNRTLLGSDAAERSCSAVSHSKARFKVIMNELPIQQFYALPYDRWEGYEAERQRVLSGLQEREERRVPDHRRPRDAGQRRPLQDARAGRPDQQRHPRHDRRARGDGELRRVRSTTRSASRSPGA